MQKLLERWSPACRWRHTTSYSGRFQITDTRHIISYHRIIPPVSPNIYGTRPKGTRRTKTHHTPENNITRTNITGPGTGERGIKHAHERSRE